MQLDCPRCGTPLMKRGKIELRGKEQVRYNCPKCNFWTVKGVNHEDTKIIERAVASTLRRKLGEQK